VPGVVSLLLSDFFLCQQQFINREYKRVAGANSFAAVKAVSFGCIEGRLKFEKCNKKKLD
jgi:hypothetical protein